MINNQVKERQELIASLDFVIKKNYGGEYFEYLIEDKDNLIRIYISGNDIILYHFLPNYKNEKSTQSLLNYIYNLEELFEHLSNEMKENFIFHLDLLS